MFIGPQGAHEVAINVVLPFAFARAELKGDTGLSDSILNVFISAVKAGENHITNQMYQQFGMQKASLKTACQQQDSCTSTRRDARTCGARTARSLQKLHAFNLAGL